MKRIFFLMQGSAFIAMNFFLLLTVFQLVQSPDSMKRPGYAEPRFNFAEDFDPSLQRLDKIDKLAAYCDSLFFINTATTEQARNAGDYPELASSIVRKRFYHGYSLYGFSNNYMAMVASKFSKGGLSAIVIPNDILRYPYAACSQQSIVLMELLRRKGFDTRAVAFQGKKGGHFCFEAYYDNSWHFYDPDMEPNTKVLKAYNRPTVAFLANHPGIMLSAYQQYPAAKMNDLFSSFTYGKINAFAAPRAFLFQKVAKFLSYTIWTFFLVLFILIRRKYLRLCRIPNVRNSRVRFPKLQTGPAPVYHLEY